MKIWLIILSMMVLAATISVKLLPMEGTASLVHLDKQEVQEDLFSTSVSLVMITQKKLRSNLEKTPENTADLESFWDLEISSRESLKFN